MTRAAMVLLLLAAAPSARGDASAPAPAPETIAFAGRTVDARAAKVVGTPGAARCPDETSFPMAIADRHGSRLMPREYHDGWLPVQLTARHLLLVNAFSEGSSQAVVVDLYGGPTLKIPGEVEALIEDNAGELLGLVSIDQAAGEVRRIDPSGRTRWRTRVQGLRGDAAYALLDGGRLYLASFEPLAGGAGVYALDWQSGALVWRGDVRDIQAPHEEYSHDVRLSLAGGNLVFEGVEGAGCTLQLFDRASGTRKLELTEAPGGWGR
jgi:hypothetical protein